MPTLPALDLSQEHFDRVVAAFPGATLAEKADAYRRWSYNNLIDFVLARETAVIEEDIRQQAESARRARVQAVLDSLPTRPAPIYVTAPMPTTP